MFELLIALAVAVLVVTGIVKVVTISTRNATFAKNQAEATRYAQEGLEWIRSERDQDWDLFTTRSNKLWCLRDLSWSKASSCTQDEKLEGTPFVRQADLTSLNDNSMEVLVRVRWTSPAGEHESRIDTRLTNWRQDSDSE